MFFPDCSLHFGEAYLRQITYCLSVSLSVKWNNISLGLNGLNEIHKGLCIDTSKYFKGEIKGAAIMIITTLLHNFTMYVLMLFLA